MKNSEPKGGTGERLTEIETFRRRGDETNNAKIEIEKLEQELKQELRELELEDERLAQKEKEYLEKGKLGKDTVEGYKRYMDERNNEPTPPTPEKTEIIDRKETKEKAKKKKRLRALLIGMGALALVSSVAFLVLRARNKNRNNVPTEQPTITTEADTSEQSSEDYDSEKDPVVIDEESSVEEADPFAGELENGTRYDYTHYGDRQMVFDENGNVSFQTKKEAWNAYDYDMSDAYGDRDATIAKIMEVANRAPEALASYVYSIFTDAEKAELGIAGMGMTEIDDYMSNHEKGGEMQAKLLAKLEQVLNDNTTRFSFYLENDTEDTNYIYFVDDNEDGRMDPTELHLGFDTRTRDNAPQVDILRGVYDHSDKEGDYYNWEKKLDLNYKCGMQPNYEKDQTPDDVPPVPADPIPDPTPEQETTEQETTEQETTEQETTEEETTEQETTEQETTEQETTEQETTEQETTEQETTEQETTEQETTEEETTEEETTEEETLAPKDKENMERIDKQIEEDIKENVGTGDIVIEKGKVTKDNKTEKPSPDVYQGTEAQTVVNEAAQPTDETTPPPVQVRQEQPGESQSEQRVNVVSPENNYTENRGGANSNEYAPVQENQAPQEEAKEAETPVAEAPGVDVLQRAAQIAAEQRATEASAASTEASTTTPPEATTVAPNETSNNELDMQAEELLEYLRRLGIE